MEKIILFFILIIGNFTYNYSQEQTIVGELIIDFVDLPSRWEIFVNIQSVGIHWDKNHNLTTQFSGGYNEYNETSSIYNMHLSSACWVTLTYEPYIGLGLYKITVGQTIPDFPYVFFYFDWRTSDLPPGPHEWDDQRFVYSYSQNKIYRYNDPNETSINLQTLTIWDEIENISLDKANLEPLPPEDLTYVSYQDHPKLLWENSPYPEYLTHFEIYRNTGTGWTKINTQSKNLLYYIDDDINIGQLADCVSYKVRSLNGTVLSSSYSNSISAGCPNSFWKNSNNNLENGNSFHLEQNYPNPFNPFTNIKFSIKEDTFVSLKLYNILGKEILTLVEGFKESGIYNIEFDARMLESGMYIYELRTDNYRNVKKLILLR